MHGAFRKPLVPLRRKATLQRQILPFGVFAGVDKHFGGALHRAMAISQRSGLGQLLPYLAVGCLFIVIATMMVLRGPRNADEGFYALASRSVYEGQVPYRDFAYTQAPLLPYLQGAAMSLVGFGVRQQRWLNVFWDACVLGVLVWRFRRSAVPGGVGAMLVGFWVCSLPLFYFCVIGKTYALVQLLLVLAAMGLWQRSSHRALLWVAAFGALAVGCRLTVAPSVVVLYVGAGLTAVRSGVSWVFVVAVPLVLVSVVFGPFVLADPANASFWMWGIHLLVLVPRHSWFSLICDSLMLAPAMWGAMGFALWRVRTVEAWRSPDGCCALAGFVGAVANIIASGIYVEYAAPFFALILAGLSGLLTATRARPNGWRMAGMAGLLLASATGSVLFVGRASSMAYLAHVDDAAAYLAKNTGGDAVVLTSMPEVVLAAGRRHHPRLAMGQFSVSGEMSDEAAERLRIMHVLRLQNAIDQGMAEAIVLRDPEDSNFAISVPSLKSFRKAYLEQIILAVNRRYYLAYQNAMFRVYLRRSEPPEAALP